MPKKNKSLPSKEYWEKREAYKLKQGLKDINKIEKELAKVYKEAMNEMVKEINNLFYKYATDNNLSYKDMFLGNIGGCIGEISALALLIGFGYMIWRKVITWHIPIYYLATVLVMTTILYYATGNAKFLPLAHLLSGGLMLGAIFMATDYTTSPMTIKGQIIFAICCGFLTVVIRSFSAYPEGVSFAILIMNAFVPLIDKYAVQRYYGEKK